MPPKLNSCASQPDYSREMESKFRAQRCDVFRGYLGSLTSDFKRVCEALKIVMVHSEPGRPDLATVLVHQQMLFATGMLGIHFRLALYRWGICSVDVAGLVRIFDGMRVELCNMGPSAVPSCRVRSKRTAHPTLSRPHRYRIQYQY